MEYLLDTANIEEIKRLNEYIPVSGITTNPSIMNKEGKVSFFDHMNEIREIIGQEKTLHIQVVADDYEGILKDVDYILENVDQDVFVKIPVSKNGLKAIKELKDKGVNVTATAIYTKVQAYLAIAAGADYIAPYYNRMDNLNIDPVASIQAMAEMIEKTESDTKILAASFKNIGQVNRAFEIGAHTATVSPEILEKALEMPSIQKAINDFTADWEDVYGQNSTIADL